MSHGDDTRTTLARLSVQDSPIRGNLATAIIGTPVVTMSTSQVSQVDLLLVDDEFRFLRSGLFTAGSPVSFERERLEVAVIETTGTLSPQLSIKARSRGVQRLKREKGERVWSNVSPTDVARQAARSKGLAFKGEPSSSRASISRAGADSTGNADQTQWDLLRDLAAEEGFILFEAEGTLHFASPTWLTANAEHTWRLGFPNRPGRGSHDIASSTIPNCRRSANDEDDAVEISFTLSFEEGEHIRPGHALRLTGIPTFTGRYLIDSVSIPLDHRSPVEISASTPIDPDPREAATDVVEADLGTADFSGEGSFDYTSPPATTTPAPPASQTFAGSLIWPTRGVVTSEFGPRSGRTHQGIDIGGNDRQRIVAAADGIVTRAAYSSSYGWVVYLDHSIARNAAVRLLTTRYAHMRSKPLVGETTYVGGAQIVQRTRVKQGQTLGYVGSTGRSTGPHLHFEVRFRSSGAAINPRTRLSGSPTKVSYVPSNVR